MAATLARDLVRRRLPAGASPNRREIAPGRTLSPMPSEQKGAYGGHPASWVRPVQSSASLHPAGPIRTVFAFRTHCRRPWLTRHRIGRWGLSRRIGTDFVASVSWLSSVAGKASPAPRVTEGNKENVPRPTGRGLRGTRALQHMRNRKGLPAATWLLLFRPPIEPSRDHGLCDSPFLIPMSLGF